MKISIRTGEPYPLGASWDGRGVNFALFSSHGERVELCLFDAGGRYETARVTLPGHSNDIFHGYLPELRPGALYGYRVYGPYQPEQGHRFNPYKLLLDPYAKQLSGALRWTDAHYGYRVGSARADLSFDRRDNARSMPKGVVVDPSFVWQQDRPLRTPWSRTMIYETHVRGFSIRHPALPEALRGSFAGLAAPACIDYIRSLGVTAVELLPVQAFVDERFLVEKNLSNYWGYSTLGFFAPEPRYMSGAEIGEFKTMVRHFHDAGIEVILDVVYNHTAEGNELGPTLSFRGIDNASYYRLLPGEQRYYINDSGCGNTVNVNHPRVLQMVLDSLRYWVTDMHVDGFRFDLASALGREPHGFDPQGRFFSALQQDPVLARVKLIAEPWDIGPGGYQLGNYPPAWAEWNDRFRDTVRRFWRGDSGCLPELAARLHGSNDLFDQRGRPPWTSVNYVASHDGFTAADVSRYAERHNQANGEDNRDGHGENYSANYGVEGDSDNGDAALNALRDRQTRNLLATVFLAKGTPMLLAGDEFNRSQSGNNNAYCQDNELSWLDWELAARQAPLTDFVRRLTRLRRDYSVLTRGRFQHGERRSTATGLPDIAWLRADGQPMTDGDWHDSERRCLGLFLAGDCEPLEQAETPDDSLLVLFNADQQAARFTLPPAAGRGWRPLLSTANEPAVLLGNGAEIELTERSLAVLALAAVFLHHRPGPTGAKN